MNKYRAPHEAYWGVVAQGLGLVVGLLFILFSPDKLSAVSFVLGYLTCFLPNVVFYRLFFRYRGAQHLNTIKNRFYFGETVKLLLTAGMFAMIWQMFWVKPGWVLCGYGMGLVCFFLPAVMTTKRASNELK